MPPRKQPSAPATHPREDRIERLTNAVETLAQETNVLRIAIDDIREELAYAVKILKTNLWLPTSQTADPPTQAPLPAARNDKKFVDTLKDNPVGAEKSDATARQGNLF